MRPPTLLQLRPALAALLLAAPLAAPLWAQAGGHRVDLSRPIFIGDSLTAGYQNGSLHEDFQPRGYASWIAARADVPLPLPLIAAPGIPAALTLVAPGPPPVIVQLPGQSVGRVDPTLQAMNLAVPGHRVQDALTTRPDLAFNDLTDLVLGLPGLLQGFSRSQVEWAEALEPSVVFVWLGSNDALVAALFADATLITPPEEFAAAYDEVMARLAATGADLVVANVPDVTVIPYLTSAAELADLLNLPPAVVGAVLGVGAGDFVIPDAFPLIELILTGQVTGPLPPEVVFDAAEVAIVRDATTAYNAVIAAQAAAHHAIHVDVHGLLGDFDRDGVVVGGQRLRTGFLGGLFSLDGVHPSDTGHALLANEFIHALNARGAAGVPPIEVRSVMMADPLVFPGVGHPPASPAELAGPAAAALCAILSG